jgi:GNAT superfamily N-acetyltransferase
LSTALGYESTTEQLNARLQPILGHPEHAVFVAETGGAGVVGFIQIVVKRCVESDTVAEIVGLVVDERLRGGGIGRALVAEAERWATARGLDAVIVRSRVHRSRAHSFYERLDYRHLKDQRVFRKTLR